MPTRRLALACVLFSAVSVRAADRPPAGDCVYEVVRPDTGPRRAAFMTWFKGNLNKDDSYLAEMDDGVFEVRIADIDNDGSDEYVLTDHEGSGSYFNMWVFRPAGPAWTRVSPTPLDDQLTAAHDYRGPDGSEFLVRFCGKTYVTLRGGGDLSYFPDSYVWERGAARTACDTGWLKHRRRTFQSLFDKARYEEAHSLLDGVQASCAAAADADLWLWMQSDVALAALRTSSYDDCLEHVGSARKSAAFARASAGVRKALDTNAALCTAAREKKRAAGTAATYDPSWVRDVVKRDPSEQIVLDPRFDALLSALVPEAKLDGGPPVRQAVKLSLWMPDDARIVEGRYVVLSGCEPHNCGNRGLMWIDITSRKAIAVLSAALVSTTVDPAHIPAEFWGEVPFPAEMELTWIGPSGETKVTVPSGH